MRLCTVVVVLVVAEACGDPGAPPVSVDAGATDRPADRDVAAVDTRPDAGSDVAIVPDIPTDSADAGEVAVDSGASDAADRPVDRPSDTSAPDSALDTADPSRDTSPDVTLDGPTGPVSCTSDRDCPGDHYCRFGLNSCGVCLIPPCQCVARPTTCEPPGAARACGCDRRIYCSHCALARAGVNEAMAGTCSGFVGPCIP